MKTLLLTGWAGYIGSHNAVWFLEKGYNVIIIDNLSNASEEVIKNIQTLTGKAPIFYKWDLRNKQNIETVFQENSIDTVIHFAGLKSVGESCQKPYEYYENNVNGTINLTQVMEQHGVTDIIFSSSATVYNPDEIPPFSENTKTGNTTNPYGTTKLLIENILRDLSTHCNFRVINLRYFNPIGAHDSGLIGENPNDIPNNLLPYIMKVTSGELEELSVFGNDYSTLDGTGVRDYIHVVDLAQGHLSALKWLENNSEKHIFENINLGTGKGTSVQEMIQITESITERPLPYKIVWRRSGDIASAYCSPRKAKELLDWEAKRTVAQAVADSWNFIQTHTWK